MKCSSAANKATFGPSSKLGPSMSLFCYLIRSGALAGSKSRNPQGFRASTRGTSSRCQASQEAERFNTPVHAKRGEILTEGKVIHERVINFRGKGDTFQEHILALGWEFMYDPVIPINMTLVGEFYANCNQKNQHEVYMRGRKIPCFLGDIERVLHIPRLEGASEHKKVGEKYDKNELDMDEVMQVIGREGETWPEVPGRTSSKTLNKDAWMWIDAPKSFRKSGRPPASAPDRIK
ncbi:hypothetical protein PIB30_096634 [Stylosanthes scabra]|uniref:Putative plant transposon protein domain-containing protein n=1 Tax=Stylosanthes scabra TaxID=79078 RepID=A0ABU6SYJ5_9FABA|nr:hypothetical protein [Stylosanthes scabra]